MRPTQKGTKRSAKSSTVTSKAFTEEERGAIRDRVQEMKAGKVEGESAVLAKIAEMREPDRDRKSTRLNSSHRLTSRMPSSAGKKTDHLAELHEGALHAAERLGHLLGRPQLAGLVELAPPRRFCEHPFVFNDPPTTEIYTFSDTLSLHDALPIWSVRTSPTRSHRYCADPSGPPREAMIDRKSTRLNSSHRLTSRMPSSA